MKRFTGSLSQLLLIPVLLVLGVLSMLPAVPTLAAGSGTWTLTGSLHVARADSTATLLANGQVLVVGGGGTSAELYNPATGSWTTTGSLHIARDYPSATLLPNGQVLVAGGSWAGPLASAELYNPATGAWTPPAACIRPATSTPRPSCRTGRCWSPVGITRIAAPLSSLAPNCTTRLQAPGLPPAACIRPVSTTP